MAKDAEVFIPAAFLVEAWRVSITDGESSYEVQPVVGWHICAGVAYPVLLEPEVNNEIVLLKMPDGTFLEPEVARYKTLEEAAADLVERVAKVAARRLTQRGPSV